MGTHKSRHNRGRKPVYKEHRLNYEAGSENRGLSSSAFVAQSPCAQGAVSALWAATGQTEVIWDCGTQERSGDIAPVAGGYCTPKVATGGRNDCRDALERGDGENMGAAVQGGIGGQISSPQRNEGRADAAETAGKARVQSLCEGTISPGTKDNKGVLKRNDRKRAPAVRRGARAGTNFESSTPATYQDTGVDTSNKEVVVKRLSDAAAHFWHYLPKEERMERVHETLVEILDREQRGETHKISWWAKWMFVRLHGRAQKAQKMVPVEDIGVYMATCRATQIDVLAAHQAIELLPRLPLRHRKVIELLIDGADPLQISDEMSIPIISVLGLIRDTRTWLADGGAYLSEDVSHRVFAKSFGSGSSKNCEALKRKINFAWDGQPPFEDTRFRAALKAAWLEEYGNECPTCESHMRFDKGDVSDRTATLDHIIARALGGTHALDNLQVICNRCNNLKSSYECSKSQQLGSLRTVQ